MGSKKKIVLFASGSGSNAENIVKVAQDLEFIEILGLICDKANAGVFARMEKLGIACAHIPLPAKEQFESSEQRRVAHEQAILSHEWVKKCDWALLAGYMRLMTPLLLNHFKREDGLYQMINIHPSLLPSFAGVDGYGDAFRYGVKVSGCTVHLVDEGMDSGPILLQDVFKRESKDTLESFKSRGMALEYEVYAKALKHLNDDTLLSLIN